MNGLFTDEYDINQARLNKARERYPDMNITMRVSGRAKTAMYERSL